MAPLLVTLVVTLFAGLNHSTGSPTDQLLPLLAEPAVARPPSEAAPSDEDLDELASYLTELLIEDPWEEVGDPLVYISTPEDETETVPMPLKRGRYHRRYTWKRQNGRDVYNPEGYICNPTKDDVFQLLLALHHTRSGRERRTVYFCNKQRPARSVFSNIRFLGRRK